MSDEEQRVIVYEDFSHGMENWWVEGGEAVWVENARLMMRSDGPDVNTGCVCTAWCRIPHPENFCLELDAHVIASKTHSNNINLFFSYSDPAGTPLFETRHARKNADYGLYHNLNGHIVTFLNDRELQTADTPRDQQKARARIRHCPGFKILNEARGYHCLEGNTYHLQVLKRGGHVAFSVDGKTMVEATDPEPLGGGLFGLRTFRTFLWWDNIKITSLAL